MAEGIRLHGFDELDKKLHELPEKVAKKILRQSTIEAAKVVQKEAEVLVKRKTKVKGKAIRIITSQKGSRVTCHITPTKKHWALCFLETGTVLHEIVAKKAKVLADVKRGIIFGKRVMTQILPKPFLRPAMDNKKMQALDVLGKELGGRITAEAVKK